MSHDLMDDIFEQVLEEASNQYVDSVEPLEDEKVVLSELHEAKMKKLMADFQKQERMKKYASLSKKVAVILIATVAIFGGLVITVEAIKKQMKESKLEERKNEYMSISFLDQDEYEKTEENVNSYQDEFISFGYLPEGFEIEYEKEARRTQYYKFVNGSQSIGFRVNSKESYFSNVDLEDAVSETFTINDNKIVKKIKNDSVISYIWSDDEYKYAIVSKDISDEILLKVIEKIKILKKF